MKELIALVKANPGKYSYAQPADRLDAASRRRTVQAELRPRPRDGAVHQRRPRDQFDARRPHADRVHRAAAGDANIQAGKLRGLAVMASKRTAGLPDVPTMAEAGIPDQESDTLTGIVVHAGTPKEHGRPLA